MTVEETVGSSVGRPGAGAGRTDSGPAEPPPDTGLVEPVTAPEPSGSGQLVRNSAVVGIGTMLSRVTGVLRTIIAAVVLGSGALASGYNLANTTPNMVYDLVLGGTLSATLVPILVANTERNDDESTSAVVTVLGVALATFTVIALIAAPWIFRIYTWSTGADNAHRLESVGVPLLRWFLPQIFFYGMTALAEALLYARRVYGAPSFVPVLNNVVMFCILGAFWRVGGHAPTAHQLAHDPALLALLGGGTTAGIVVMAVALWPAMRRAGIRLRWRFDHRNRAVRKVFTLSGWTLSYAIVNQVTLAVVLALAARRATDVNAYTYAFAFFQMPYALFAVSITVTIVPELSTSVARAEAANFRRQFALGLRFLLVVMVPAAVGCAVLGQPIVEAFLGHGRYRSAAPVTGDVFTLFSVGMVGYAVYLYSLRVFYTLRDTFTPLLLNLVENGVNIALAVLFVFRFDLNVQGLALAYAIAYSVGALAALWAVKRRILHFDGARNRQAAVKVAVASAVMGLAVWTVLHWLGTPPGFESLIPTLAGVVTGAVVYAALVWGLRVEEVTDLVGRFRSRLAR